MTISDSDILDFLEAKLPVRAVQVEIAEGEVKLRRGVARPGRDTFGDVRTALRYAMTNDPQHMPAHKLASLLQAQEQTVAIASQRVEALDAELKLLGIISDLGKYYISQHAIHLDVVALCEKRGACGRALSAASWKLSEIEGVCKARGIMPPASVSAPELMGAISDDKCDSAC